MRSEPTLRVEDLLRLMVNANFEMIERDRNGMRS
jgi:hypothetical protein